MTALRPVVLLHPIGSDNSFFDPLLAHLDGVTAVRPDLLGHGQVGPHSTPPALTDYAADIVGQLDDAGHDLVDVIGVSLGALVAATLAAEYPHRIGKVVLADSVPTYPPNMVTMWADRATAAIANGIGAFVEPTMNLWFTADFLDNRPDLAYIRTVLESTDPRGYADACRVLAAADVRGAALAMPHPTLVACGTEDAAPFQEGAEWFAGAIQDAKLVWIAGGRHACFFENAREVAAVVTDFLTR
jgi:3-oxoadipate enol-lactonase